MDLMVMHGNSGTHMKTTLVVLADGIGARYGKGIKQLEPAGPNRELIIGNYAGIRPKQAPPER